MLRRILRRAVRYGTEVLKAQPGFFSGYTSATLYLFFVIFLFSLDISFVFCTVRFNIEVLQHNSLLSPRLWSFIYFVSIGLFIASHNIILLCEKAGANCGGCDE